MNKVFALSMLSLSTIFFTACATQKSVKTTALKNINYEVVGLGKTALEAKQAAINVANQMCGKDATPIVLSENTAYQGVLNETTGKVLQKASNVVDKIKGSQSEQHNENYKTVFVIQCR